MCGEVTPDTGNVRTARHVSQEGELPSKAPGLGRGSCLQFRRWMPREELQGKPAEQEHRHHVPRVRLTLKN